MVEVAMIIFAVIAFAGGVGLAAAYRGTAERSRRDRGKRPLPQALPATQTADVKASAGADPSARL